MGNLGWEGLAGINSGASLMKDKSRAGNPLVIVGVPVDLE